MARTLVWIGFVLCFSACTQSGDGADMHESLEHERIFAQPISVDELVAEVQSLGSLLQMQGDCVDLRTSADNNLGRYLALSRRGSVTADELVIEAYELIASKSGHSVIENAAKLMIISRLVFDVPEAFEFIPPSEKPEDDLGDDEYAEHYRNDPRYPYMYVGVPGSIRFWKFTLIDEMELNYFYPLEYDEPGRICMTTEEIAWPQSGADLTLPTEELEYFRANFRRRDLMTFTGVVD